MILPFWYLAFVCFCLYWVWSTSTTHLPTIRSLTCDTGSLWDCEKPVAGLLLVFARERPLCICHGSLSHLSTIICLSYHPSVEIYGRIWSTFWCHPLLKCIQIEDSQFFLVSPPWLPAVIPSRSVVSSITLEARPTLRIFGALNELQSVALISSYFLVVPIFPCPFHSQEINLGIAIRKAERKLFDWNISDGITHSVYELITLPLWLISKAYQSKPIAQYTMKSLCTSLESG